jgi:thiol:disulfide interchange protein
LVYTISVSEFLNERGTQMNKILISLILGVLLMSCCGGGKCKSNVANAVMVSSNSTVELTVDSEVKYKDGDEIVLQFSADWCGPCRTLKALIKKDDAIQKHFKEQTKGYFIIDIDSDDPNHKAWTNKAKPTSIPLVVRYVYKEGAWVEAHRFMGLRNATQILQWLQIPITSE